MNYRNFIALISALFAYVLVSAQPCLEFSHEHGFYKSSFQLVIKSKPQNGTIIYTMDGSDPRHTAEAFTAVSPAEITIDPYIPTGRVVSPGVVVRACTIVGQDTSRAYTQTYIFLSEVKYQKDVSTDMLPYWPDKSRMPCYYSPNLLDWMKSEYQSINLETYPEVIFREEYYSGFEDDLLSIPTFSLVTDPKNLFDPVSGIYINSTWTGKGWERPGSIELINPSDEGFQCNTGIRIRGGYSSSGVFAKHAFRLFFREEYGDPKLEYPLFGDKGTDSFDKIDLRCEQNNSWSAPGGNNNADYIHDAFSRDIQGEMDKPYTRSSYYHLFLNGMYWGLYETQERAEARFAVSYMGGDKEDYDVVKSSAGAIDYPTYSLEATDGDLNSSKALWDIAIEGFTHDNYFKAQGLNPNGTKNPSYPKYLDVDNLISYIMIIYFSGNTDGPGELGGGIRINNFFGIFNRTNPDGFKYCIHDNETSYTSYRANITNKLTMAGWTFDRFNPMWLHQQLISNLDYRQRFADLAWKYLFNGGVLTEQKNIDRFQVRINWIDKAIIGESARWGGLNRVWPVTRNETWLKAVNTLQQTYFPNRTKVVISQYKDMGWLNNLTPPVIDTNDVIIGENKMLTRNGQINLINSNASGVIYYTADNTDPRISEGGISEKALTYASAINAQKTIFLKARVKDGEQWSPIYETAVMKNDGSELLISEISYNPEKQISGNDTLESSDLEFVEIKNKSQSDIDISGYKISEGISFEFPQGTQLNADGLIVLASDSLSFRKLYGFSPFGQFGGNLNNEKEKIILKNPCGAIISSIEYNSDGTWFDAADGAGFTLVASSYLINQLADMQPNWRISTKWLGSPGKDDPLYTAQPIAFNEVLANSRKPKTDFIELTNTGNTTVNIGNWFLSDENDTPAKWKIPLGTIIEPGGFLSFSEGHYVADSMHCSANEFGSSFSLSKGGETIYLYTNGENGKPGSFVAEYKYGATDENYSFGKYISLSGNELQLQLETPSPGIKNGNARLSPIVFKAIMYHPVDGNYEYLVLKNRSDSTVNLFYQNSPETTWKINGIDFEFPEGVSVSAGDSLFLVEKMLPAGEFRSLMNLPSSAMIFNYPGKLSNGGETVSIEKPLLVETDSIAVLEYITPEAVNFNDKKPWPTKADGKGYALYRIDEDTFGNDASNWTEIRKVIPVAIAGNNSREWLNTLAKLDGSGSYDPAQLPLTYEWKLELAPSGSKASLSDRYVVSPNFTCDKEGNYLFSLMVDNGINKSATSYVSIFGSQNTAPVTQNYNRNYNIKLDQIILLGAFDCFDINYDSLTYNWNLTEKPEGSMYELYNFYEKSFNFKADMVGNYTFSLNTSDGVLSGTAITINVKVSQPSGIIAAKTGNKIEVYPNPVTNEAFVEFTVKKGTNASLQIISISGQVISKLNLGSLEAGNQIIPFDFRNQKSGIYFVSIKTNEFTETKKVYYMPRY